MPRIQREWKTGSDVEKLVERIIMDIRCKSRNCEGWNHRQGEVNRNRWKYGLTLTEVIVVLVIMAILMALAIPAVRNYMKLAEFRRNESHAKTAYLAAESTLTWYRTSGRWEEFRKEVIHSGTLNETFSEGDQREGRIYALISDQSAPGENASGNLVKELLEGTAFDREDTEGIIALEIDIDTGQVYSAFYGSRCRGLSYEESEDGSVLNISAAGDNRAYGNRRERLLGYYSTEDVTNAVDLKPARLKITTINLVNRETLSLNWSSNSRHDNLDVNFHIIFYQKEASGDDLELFSMDVDRYLLRQKYGLDSPAVGLELTKSEENGTETEAGTWYFPLSYENGRFSLILDAVMSAELMETLKAGRTGDGAQGAEEASVLGGIRAYSTSITRFALGDAKTPAAAPSLALPQDIYAVISVQPTYENMEGDSREYRGGSPVRSNTENTMFATGTKQDGDGECEAGISQYRHLSNIRYCEQIKAKFKLTSRNMDWMSAGTGLYNLKKDGSGFLALSWQSAAEGAVDFPTIPLLAVDHTLTGSGESTLLSNLRLGKESLADDEVIRRLYGNSAPDERYGQYLGLFGQVEGDIRNLILQDPQLILAGEGASENIAGWEHLQGAGILCGRSQGSLENIAVRSGSGKALVRVLLADRQDADNVRVLGIGGLAGVLAKTGGNGEPLPLNGTDVSLYQLTMEGSVEVRLPSPGLSQEPFSRGGITVGDSHTVRQAAGAAAIGAGGIFGYGRLADVTLTNCENHASVKGNLFTGGIGGNLTGSYGETGLSQYSCSLEGCKNDGLVLCTTPHREDRLEGRYFGGILGYGNRVWIESCFSASGRAEGYQYSVQEKDKLLGQYVGGIIGYGSGSLLTGCSTQKDGYVLGSDYVGGIAGGLSNNIADVIQGSDSGVTVTVNAGYVIGMRYVGGIVGINGDGLENSVISDCVNNGAAAGYDRYVGGIVGYNGANGQLTNCASYLSDYDNSVFDMIVNTWKASGDCAGGLAGYNDGLIQFDEDASNIVVKAVSSVVAGRNFVGGMIGFNDRNGKLDTDYALIGGRIYGYGDAVGGCIGLNASEEVFNEKLVIRPQGIRGRYCVGGVIGADVVELSQDRTALDFRTDNALGSISITGRAFTGGVIGYQRTYTQEQLDQAAEKAGINIPAGENVPIADYMMLAYDETVQSGYISLLPGLGEGNLPTPVLPSENAFQLVIGNRYDSESHSYPANNNVTINSYLYTGGIVGYCEKNSRLVLKDCINAGNINRPEPLEEEERALAAGVSLKRYMAEAADMGKASLEAPELSVHMVGGIISGVLENQVVDRCTNTGNMSGFVGLGGIVSFNAGGIFNCGLSGNFGNAILDCIGGIAGLNGRADNAVWHTYTDVKNKKWEYTSGLIAGCSTQAGRNVLGHSYVGGIVGYNMSGAQLRDNESCANVSGSGDYVGGIVGVNAGNIWISEDKSTASRTVTGALGIGGLAGWNKAGGIITGTDAGSEELVAVNSHVTVNGTRSVGGLFGIQEGEIRMTEGRYLTCQAHEVRAREGWAGGIIGEVRAENDKTEAQIRLIISRVRNKSAVVTADRGPAGGITAINGDGVELTECQSFGSVNSSEGFAGGIAAENYGTISNCTVKKAAQAAEALGTVVK